MKIMAIDYGDARTGISICDKTELLASPFSVIHEKDIDRCITDIKKISDENFVEEIIVGHPKNMDGSVGPRAIICEIFKEKLQNILNNSVKVLLWDERSTTVSATHYLNQSNVRGKKRKNTIDAVAATIILESYLMYRRNKKLTSKN